MPGSASIAIVDSALESTVKAVFLELESIRVYAVASAFVKEIMEMMDTDSVTGGISAADTAKAYQAVLNGSMSGETLDVTDLV